MDRDELAHQLTRASEADPEAVDRIVLAALSSGGPQPERWRRTILATSVTAFIGVAAVLGWWATRERVDSAAGVFRASATMPIAPEAPTTSEPQAAPAPDGVFRVEATLTPRTRDLIRVTATDGTSWILSPDAGTEWLPPGGGFVVGGGGSQ